MSVRVDWSFQLPCLHRITGTVLASASDNITVVSSDNLCHMKGVREVYFSSFSGLGRKVCLWRRIT